jgi:hypothetical protein
MVDAVFIHYSESGEVSAATIDGWHKARGFEPRGTNPLRYIGYHYVIHSDGRVELGRSDDVQGTHCPGWNIPGVIALCLIGSDREPGYPSESQYHVAATLIEHYQPRYVWLHREQYSTSCPGMFDKGYLLSLVGQSQEEEEEEMPRFEKLRDYVYNCARVKADDTIYIHAESADNQDLTFYSIPFTGETVTTVKGVGGWANFTKGANYTVSEIAGRGFTEGRMTIHSPVALSIEVG